MRKPAERIYFCDEDCRREEKEKNDFPNVLLHDSALTFVALHQEGTRHIIVRRTEVGESCDNSRTVFMRTENSDFLATAQVTRVLKIRLSIILWTSETSQ